MKRFELESFGSLFLNQVLDLFENYNLVRAFLLPRAFEKLKDRKFKIINHKT